MRHLDMRKKHLEDTPASILDEDYVDNTHRATNMMSDTHRATNMMSDTHRATNMMSDPPRANYMTLDSPHPSHTVLDTPRAHNMMLDTPQPGQILRDIGITKVLGMLAQVLQENKEMRGEISKLSQEVRCLRREIGSRESEEAPCSIKLPLGDEEGFDQAETILREPSEKKKMVSFFALVGGHTAEIITRRMLGQAMTNSLACHFNWAGKGQKRAFKNTVLHDVMFAALQKQLSGSTAVVFGETVKKWLKYAPEREGGVPRNAQQD
ncbi:uncharacterized protein LOC134087287 isoform X2 [Sardina pilchardus]|uniref:uncharacterized protein LOC134087287 isoform X2 n=1 Tax=Sardina pilchardus TaxID=27697 RepID=UPI002E16629A